MGVPAHCRRLGGGVRRVRAWDDLRTGAVPFADGEGPGWTLESAGRVQWRSRPVLPPALTWKPSQRFMSTRTAVRTIRSPTDRASGPGRQARPCGTTNSTGSRLSGVWQRSARPAERVGPRGLRRPDSPLCAVSPLPPVGLESPADLINSACEVDIQALEVVAVSVAHRDSVLGPRSIGCYPSALACRGRTTKTHSRKMSVSRAVLTSRWRFVRESELDTH